MPLWKRVFGRQSARVASATNACAANRRPSTIVSNEDGDEDEDKSAISARDDTALILSRPPKPNRRIPVHSNSLACLFNERNIARSLTVSSRGNSIPAKNMNRPGLLLRSTSALGRIRFLSTATPGQFGTVCTEKPISSCPRTRTFNDLANLGRSGDGYRLTAHQRSLIRQCWNEANKRGRNVQSAGSYVLRWLLKRESRLKRKFDLVNVANDQLDEDRRFQKYAKSFTDMIEMVVDSVSAERDSTSLLDDIMGPFLCSYGSEQAAIEKSMASKYEDVSFRPCDWELLAAAMREYVSECWRSNGLWMPLGSFQKRNEALHAWNVLVHFIVAKIKRGYEFELEKVTRKPKISLGGKSNS